MVKKFVRVEIGNAVLYQGDAVALIPEIEGFDALITDPPYSSGGMTRADRSLGSGQKYMSTGKDHRTGKPSRPSVDIDIMGDNRDARGWAFWCYMWLQACFARLPAGAFMVQFTDWRQLPQTTDVIQAAGFIFRGICPWIKPNFRRQSGRFGAQAEYMVWGSKGVMKWDFTQPPLPGHFMGSAPAPGKRLHQTEKSLSVMAEIVQGAKPGCTILDPFMGAATTGVAALQSGRKFIGIEMHPEYFKIACRRIEQAQKQTDLF